jgi:hypothetical protein
MRAPIAVPALIAAPALIAVLAGCDPDRPPALAPSFEEIPGGTDIAGGCPNKFSMKVSVKVTAYDVVGRDPADDNGDKLVCSLVTKDPVFDANGELLRKGVIVQIDNNIPANKLGKCPMSFTAVAVYEALEDANRNSVVCKGQTEDLGTAVSDDNDG